MEKKIDISEIDKNFKIDTKINKSDIKFYDVSEGHFELYGLHTDDCMEPYHRMDFEVGKSVSEHIHNLNRCTAGGRIRFKTNSSYVAVYNDYTIKGIGKSSHMTTVGASGFDVYIVEDGIPKFFRILPPAYDFGDEYETYVDFGDNEERELLIHFPLYNGSKKLYIGLQENAYIKPATKYTYQKPIVFYGSSITQGGSVTRPGLTYENHVSRHFDTDFINLGFSGNCKGEDIMAEYIAKLDMSIFVYDYDHNAPNAEYLANTHKRFFKIFRKYQPDTPVIMMSKTDRRVLKNEIQSILTTREIVKQTYENAKASGDKNVYFVDGQKTFGLTCDYDCTVDSCHPNDLGHYCMGLAVIKVIEENKLLG